MKISKIEQITTAYERIKELDQEIIFIEHQARDFSENDRTIELSLKCLDDKRSDRTVDIDEDGSLRYGGDKSHFHDAWLAAMRGTLGINPEPVGYPAKKKKTNILEMNLDCSQALQILGVLLASKQLERREWVRKLERLGVEL